MTKRPTYIEAAKALIPGPKAEDWRYADLSLIRKGELPLASKDDRAVKVAPVTDWPRIVIANGVIVEKPDLTGVEISKPPAVAVSDHPLARLNADHANTGVMIKIGNGSNLEGLEIIILEDGDTEGARHVRNAILVEKDAKAEILLRCINNRASGWLNAVTDVAVGQKAALSLASDFEAANGTLISNFVKAGVEDEGTLDVFAFGLGLPSLRNEIEVDLKGPGSTTNLAGGLLAADNETVDFVTRVTHSSGHANSNQTFRAVAGKGGSTAFQGRVVVAEDAQKTEAHQNCHNLILEAGGEANVKPELLIFADDVVCSHGATVGEIDEASLFYMMQRGIPEAQARAILVQAFLGDILEAIRSEALHDYIAGRVSAWMEKNLKGSLA